MNFCVTASLRHLENDFQLDRRAERKTCHSIYQPTWIFLFAENVLKQLRGGVCHFRLIANISRSCYRNPEPDDPGHSVERSQKLPCDREGIERRQASCLTSCFHF